MVADGSPGSERGGVWTRRFGGAVRCVADDRVRACGSIRMP
jgi:hypothetical protein